MKKCNWKADRPFDEQIYETDCGKAFVFIDGGPAQNDYFYCPFCGQEINDVTEIGEAENE